MAHPSNPETAVEVGNGFLRGQVLPCHGPDLLDGAVQQQLPLADEQHPAFVRDAGF